MTGGTGGIGRAFATALASEGASVVGTAIAVQLDISDAAATEPMVGSTVEHFGRMDWSTTPLRWRASRAGRSKS